MAAEDGKNTKDSTACADDTSNPMGEMMSQMMKMCRTGAGGLPGCAAIMQGMMKPAENPSPRPHKEPDVDSEEKKK